MDNGGSRGSTPRCRIVALARDRAKGADGGGDASGKTRRTTAAAPQPAAPQPITFAEYRDFRLQAMARRQAQLSRELAAPDLSAAQKATLEGKKAYYDRIAAMTPDDRDKLYRARFGQIDTDHDGTIDEAERAAWREKQHAYYAQLAAGRAGAGNTSH